jgi:hypothetical protein
MPDRQSGGVNIHGGSVNVGRDLVGRDKIERHEHIHMESSGLEEKGGCAFAIERGVTFLATLLIGGLVLVIFLGIIGAVVDAALDLSSGSGLPAGAVCGGVAGLLLALGSAVAATASISRYRKP